ncbi:AIR synthase-related protein, partial [Dolichospermum circinale CS-545/17]|nr:AIR synthase-related protein [Dolichospermum circinale CS-545/17]
NQGQAIKMIPESWTIPPIFRWLAGAGSVGTEAMYHTFNMGIGFVLLVPPQQVEQIITHFQSQDLPAYVIGEVITGTGELVNLL